MLTAAAIAIVLSVAPLAAGSSSDMVEGDAGDPAVAACAVCRVGVTCDGADVFARSMLSVKMSGAVWLRLTHGANTQGESMSSNDERVNEDALTEEEAEVSTPEYLPVDSPAYVRKFLRKYFDTLCREATRTSYQYNIPDFADDALSITIEKFMTSRIENRGPRSAIGFAVRILRNTCIDEARRRGRHAIPAGALMTDEEDGGDFIEQRVAVEQEGADPESALIASHELRAIDLGFVELPRLVGKTHKNVERDLDIVYKRYLLRMSWNDIAKTLEGAKAHRQSAARGRELLRGWVHALCSTQPEPDAANRKYWQRGHEAGQRYREERGGDVLNEPTDNEKENLS